MAARQAVHESDHLSEYERAICYYTLPKVASPTTIGLIAAYLVCLIEAAAVLGYGLWTDRPVWTRVGTVALGAVIIFGVAAFFIRTLYHEVRQRKFLREARAVHPEAPPPSEMPDPFADHLLLRRPRRLAGAAFECTDNEGNLIHRVETSARGAWRTVCAPDGRETLRVRVISRVPSVILASTMPGRLVVYQEGEEIAQAAPRFSLGDPTAEIRCCADPGVEYLIRRRAIYRQGRLVGRIYYLRRYLYLDVKKTECHPALLAYFVAMN